ncbi:MAG: beta-N-acetylhexosaminidase [Hominenteromicrobium sp.]
MLQLIPAPSGPVQRRNGVCAVPESVCAQTGGFAPWCLEALGARLHRTVRSVSAGEKSWLRLVRDDALPAEGYRFCASADGVTVSAAAEQGVVWALTTLAELAEAPEGIPQCEFEDAPRYGHRGLSLDCSRHFFPAEEIKKIIEQMARVKLNVLHWHLVDDQGWRIESLKFPLLHEKSGAYYTQAEIREIVEFARVRGVEVVPEIDLPGHTTALIAAYPQYSCAGKPVELRQHGGIFEVILCAGKEETFAFLDELLGEICPLFSSPRFHIGGDEAPKTEWKKCPHCKARMEALGLTDFEDLQGYFTNRVAEILRKYGKRAICWNDTLEAKDPDTGNQVQFWTMQHEAPVPEFIGRGGQVIASDFRTLYFDYPHALSSLRKVYGYRPVIMRRNYAGHPNLIGLEACIWSEQIAEAAHLEEMLFPRLYAVAEIAWREAGRYADFEERVTVKVQQAAAQGVNCTPKSGWNPRGSARRQAGAQFLARLINPAGAGGPCTDADREMVKPMFRMFAKGFFKPDDLPELLQNDELVCAMKNIMLMHGQEPK